MEGKQVMSTKLKFVESKRKYRATTNASQGFKLITSANNHNLAIIGFADRTIKAVAFDILFDFNPSKDKAEINNLNQFSFTHQLDFEPTLLTIARNGYSSILFICGVDQSNNCPAIDIFDLDKRSSIGRINLREVSGSEVVDYAWHPNYFDSIIALCTNRGALLVVAINKKSQAAQLVYNNQQYGALTCCWSPKGKNLAIGMANNQIMRLEPVITTTSFTFKEVDKSTLTFTHAKVTPEHQVIKLRWINKTYLLSVHARPSQPNNPNSLPDTVYSLITVKPSKPYLYWTNVCYESQVASRYIVHIANLTNTVICSSTASSEAGVIGLDGAAQAKTNELNDWNSIIIDEEGARIELPLDANNRETYPLGLTVAISQDKPIIIFYSSDGVICPYAAVHYEDILKIPEFQQPADCPVKVVMKESPRPAAISKEVSFKSQQQALDLKAVSFKLTPEKEPAKEEVPTKLPPVTDTTLLEVPNSLKYINLDNEIKSMREKIEYNQVFLGLLDEINHLRTKFEEVQEIHQIHKEVLDAVREDIDSLDLGMLENLHLIEYIKTRKNLRKKFQDPSIHKKVDDIKKKFKVIEQKLVELEINVEVSWEEYVRRSGLEKKKCSLNSLDIIYKHLANNFKIIKVLKTKLAAYPPPPKSPENYYIPVDRKELSPARMAAFKEFLSSRTSVAVRRPLSHR